MKNTLSILLMGIFVLSGSSSSVINFHSGAMTMSGAIQTISSKTVSEKGDLNLVTEDKATVFWSHREIRNLKRLDEFLYNFTYKIKDQVTVETFSKEGEPIVMDLSYDGERLFISINGVSEEYEEIFVEERFNEHYNGTFIEYIVKNGKGKKTLVLQIGPDLTKSLRKTKIQE